MGISDNSGGGSGAGGPVVPTPDPHIYDPAKIDEARQIYDKLRESIQKSEDAGRSYVRSLIEQDEALERARTNTENLLDKNNEYKRILDSQIDRLNEYSKTLNNELSAVLIKITDNTDKLNNSTETLKNLFGDATIKITNVNDATETYNKTLETLKESGKGFENVADAIENIEKKLESGEVINSEYVDSLVDLDDTQKNLIKQLVKSKIELMQAEQAELKVKSELYAKNLSLVDLQKLQKKSIEEVGNSVKGMSDKLFGASTQSNIFTSLVIGMTDKGTLAKNIFGALGESFLNPINAMNRFFNFINNNLIQSTFALDKSLSQINKDLGGLGKEFEQVGTVSSGMFKAANTADLAMYGAGIKELGKAYGDLSSKVNGFNSFTKDQRELLAKNAVAMETLGVSSQTYASLTSTFMGALGKNAQGVKNVIEGLAKDAIAAGRSVAEYTKEFEQVLPKIVGYGREATQIFKELNAFASMTKGVLSTGDLQSFASQFDNWDSAAESVSKLNVALGGASVNIADLMKADPSEKLMMLKRAFDESGQDFDKLNVGYKRMLAEGFGGDVNKAAAFFKGNIADANAEMEKMAANEAELEERRKKSTEATEKLAKALDSIKIAFTPMLDFIAGIAEKVAKFVNNFGPISSFFLVAMPLALLAFRGAIKLTGAMMSATFNTVTDDTKKRIIEVIELARQAKTEINSMNTPMPGAGTPPGTPPVPGTPPSPGTPSGPLPNTPGGAKPGLLRRMGGSIGIGGAIMLLGAASNAYSNITATNTVTNPKFLKNDEDNEQKLPVGNAIGINTHKTILEQDPETGFLNPIAHANNKDKTVELRTPGELSDQAKQIGVAVGKEIEVNNTQLSQNMSKQNESFYSATSEKLETIREVSQTKVDFNGMFTGAKFVAAIDPSDMERNNRAVISQAEEYINTRQNSKA